MSNVISIGFPRKPNCAQRQAMLLKSFAQNRRAAQDVYWLKENAEILNIMANSSAALTPQALSVYAGFYAQIEERLRFFPQYYRFLLSICLDLEDLGMPGSKGAALCHWAQQKQLPACELSDLQRAEAERLLARRLDVKKDAGLDKRLRCFIEHSDTFTLPNKKAAYELTHIVFYLSDYGAKPLELTHAAITSLEFAGLLAYLDQDIDLLSEVCVALRLAGQSPSDIWEDWLATELDRFAIAPAPAGAIADAYHEYIVANWWAGHANLPSFTLAPPEGGIEIMRSNVQQGPLRMMSEVMFHLGAARSASWEQMRRILEQKLGADQHSILSGAAQSSDQFEAFFEQFARAH